MCCRSSFSYLRIKREKISTSLFFVRHGQASFGKDEYDNLSDIGIQQSIALGKAIKKEGLVFDRAIVGPHRRHMQTFEGFLEGFNTKIPSSIEQGFAENHLMEVTQHFAPKLLESDPELIDIYNKYDDEKKFFKIFQYVAFKWANSELDLSGTDLEPYKDFRLRVRQALDRIEGSLDNESSNILIVTSGGTISAVYGEATGCSHEEIQKQNFGIQNASVSEFLYATERFTLKTFNVSFISEELKTYI